MDGVNVRLTECEDLSETVAVRLWEAVRNAVLEVELPIAVIVAAPRDAVVLPVSVADGVAVRHSEREPEKETCSEDDWDFR
jgi:hypothetical protein